MHKEVDHSGTISYPIAEKGVKVPLRGTLFPECVTLDLYEEEVKEKKKKEAEEDMDAVMEKYGEGGKVDFTSVEADTETLEEKYTRTYMAKMEESPSQCVRWCPGGRPLRTFTTPVVVPNCALCGAKRVFEFQLTAQLIYYLMQLNSISEKSNTTLHFSNIHVYACSANCYDGTPYVKEFCFTEDEL
ncbi:pre-rRNA-processing protein TSR4 [Angomonas deanei]|uniref:Programmed cell death protein 2, C-terminal putative domain containing protein, putative n=1 Tax=Angomonas deanei TaxID=59799 RepID=A0A7G2C543_9TRYP|nr:pre-rRNA-processing protein TSR4 [Angomonas deanei]CAD2214846.1 Programmed cell death protein 2, C-terminal putative domain containing protein, putative [Angomonas deanei]|eukprot:EPY38720.1 pre-rRNA-processing protein TSR4 [Angomonas deanei]